MDRDQEGYDRLEFDVLHVAFGVRCRGDIDFLPGDIDISPRRKYLTAGLPVTIACNQADVAVCAADVRCAGTGAGPMFRAVLFLLADRHTEAAQKGH